MSTKNFPPVKNAPPPKNAAAAVPTISAPEKAQGGQPDAGAGQKNAAPPTRLKVWAVPVLNTRLLTCYAEEVDPTNPKNLLSVTVADNRLFVKGQTVPVKHVDRTHFNYDGPRPRWKGDRV